MEDLSIAADASMEGSALLEIFNEVIRTPPSSPATPLMHDQGVPPPRQPDFSSSPATPAASARNAAAAKAREFIAETSSSSSSLSGSSLEAANKTAKRLTLEPSPLVLPSPAPSPLIANRGNVQAAVPTTPPPRVPAKGNTTSVDGTTSLHPLAASEAEEAMADAAMNMAGPSSPVPLSVKIAMVQRAEGLYESAMQEADKAQHSVAARNTAHTKCAGAAVDTIRESMAASTRLGSKLDEARAQHRALGTATVAAGVIPQGTSPTPMVGRGNAAIAPQRVSTPPPPPLGMRPQSSINTSSPVPFASPVCSRQPGGAPVGGAVAFCSSCGRQRARSNHGGQMLPAAHCQWCGTRFQQPIL